MQTGVAQKYGEKRKENKFGVGEKKINNELLTFFFYNNSENFKKKNPPRRNHGSR